MGFTFEELESLYQPGRLSDDKNARQDYRIFSKSIKGQNKKAINDKNMLMKDINLVITLAQNIDTSETLYLDYIREYVYQVLYAWKWYFIYITAFNTIFILWFALKLIRI